MNESQKDTQRYLAAAKLVIDDRDPNANAAAVLATLEGLVTLVLLVVMDNNPAKAAAMLNEGLVPGVERRLARASAKRLMEE